MDLNANVFSQFDKGWALLTAGSKDDFNTMTISWGGMGTLWSRPVVTVYVKPIRHTYEFMEKSDYFTVSFFPEEYKEALGILGTKSGRDCNKVELSGLTPVEVQHSMSFREASRTLVCRKLYHQDLDASQVPEDAQERYYKNEPIHRMYIGEVVEIL